MKIDATQLSFQELNQKIKQSTDKKIKIQNCCGHRYIASGLAEKELTIFGTPGNALGAYLDGTDIYVQGNVQDATGDTMNAGNIYINGMAGDATGYAMRGGCIYIHGDTGYRTGIHMKEYEGKKPLIVVGGSAGSFLGEYQAGGTIIVLGLHSDEDVPVGNFCGMGMHGGKIFIRANSVPNDLSDRLVYRIADIKDLKEIEPILKRFCELFDESMEIILSQPFYVITANNKNPYKQLYTTN